MYDEIKPRGASKGSDPNSGGAVIRETPVFGIVKDNVDPTRSGRIQVYISDIGGQDPDDANSWVTVKFMSPFYGLTQGSGPQTGYGEYLKNPHSYGIWNSPPDIGTTVICVFINGDMNFGYYIGCVPQPEALYMVPAIGSSDNIIANQGEASSLGGAPRLPVVNLNINNEGVADSVTYLKAPKPIHSYQAAILSQQGLARDPIRGVIGTTSQRESPSRVGWGISTPGRPIYEGGFTDEQISDAVKNGSPEKLLIVGRRGGHSVVLDDGDILGRDQLVRIRSAMGHQILMSDDGQTLFIVHANGQSYIELGKEGTIDMYATNSVNVRTQGDLNFHADNNINIHAVKDLNISADNIKLSSEKETAMKVGTDFSNYTIGKYTVKVENQMSMFSAGEGSYASSSTMYINGERINLNTGFTSTVPKVVDPIKINAHTDTLFDTTKGWAAAPGKLLSITSRAPAHSPWAAANQGVDVKVSNNASDALPSAPSAAVAATNEAVTTVETPQVTPVVASTVPNVGAVSEAVDKNTTSAIVGQAAVMAQTGPAAEAAKQGLGVVQNLAGQATAVVGKTALTPQQLESAGILKPGSSQLINSLTQAGKTPQEAMTNNLFTGVPGAETLNNLRNNPAAQVAATVTNLQQAQQQLTNAGLMTGKESGSQLGGMLLATASAGIGAVTGFAQTAANAATGAVKSLVGGVGGAVSSVLGPVQNLLSGGNAAAGMANAVTGGLSSIAGALGGIVKGAGAGLAGLLDSAKGVAASAFAAVTQGFPKMTPGVPQNLADIAEKAQQANNAQSAGLNIPTTNPLTAAAAGIAGAASGIAGAAGGASASVTGAVGGAISGVSSAVTGAISSVTSQASLPDALKVNSSAIAGAASGLTSIPGAENAVATIVNNAPNVSNLIPGADAVGLLAKSTAASALGGANPLSAITGSATSGLLSAGSAIAGDLTKGLGSLTSGASSLTSLASAGLPAGAAAQLNSAITSISSGGSVPVTLPTIAINTVDRSQLTNQLTSLMGSSKVPLPNFSGNPASFGKTLSEENIKEFDTIAKQVEELTDKRYELKNKESEARYELSKAKNDLPQGDPQIASLEAALKTAKQAVTDLDKQVQELNNKMTQISTGTSA